MGLQKALGNPLHENIGGWELLVAYLISGYVANLLLTWCVGAGGFVHLLSGILSFFFAERHLSYFLINRLLWSIFSTPATTAQRWSPINSDAGRIPVVLRYGRGLFAGAGYNVNQSKISATGSGADRAYV